ncbi:glycosyltransferase family A protein [Rheinheimera soli]|uniref:glycosyltransferase family A protein n=1 Tax=Rheinheimera soli TaxID=443616 RepID=UPI001E28F2FD|nr:glycosyltransferase family A protein [Rheinheimera soli]
MSSKPLFSIVLPTRDRPDLVRRVLESLVAQTFTDFEVIVSDNALNNPCLHEVSRFLVDKRFNYKRTLKPMDMCSHWDFALEGATGEYVTIFSEKFMLRPDALELMSQEIISSQPDVLTWQYEIFDVSFIDGLNLYGDYHPLIKPGNPINYDPVSELKRRVCFDFPLFCRYNKQKDSYGKIYSGAIHRNVLARIKNNYGRIFHPLSPDFTSMIAILNESKVCVDMNQSLMLVVNMAGTSNGEATKRSVVATRQFIESFGLDIEKFRLQLPIPGFWIGHQVIVSADYELIRSLTCYGPLKNIKLDKGSLAFWAQFDLEHIKEWEDETNDEFQILLRPFLRSLSRVRLEELGHNLKVSVSPSKNEIYHSGLKKVNYFSPGTTAESLADIHWREGFAPPRKPVSINSMELFQALEYLYFYNVHSSTLLELGKNGGQR